MTNRQDSLDLNGVLGSLPSDEFINVDSFFDSYVAELSQRSKRQGEDGLEIPDAKHVRRDPTAAAAAPAGAIPLAALNGGAFPGTVPIPGLSIEQQQAAIQLQLQQMQQLQQANLLAAQQGGASLLPAGQAPLAFGMIDPTTLGLQFDSGSLETIHSGGSNGSGGGGGRKSGGGGGGGGKASNKQQEANKAAQQRYRERKKAKFADMEKTVEALQQQLANLQALQQRNQILEGMNTQLQTALVDKERELERLKVTMDAQADESLAAGTEGEGEAPADSAAAVAAGNGAAGGGCGGGNDADDCVSCDVLPRDLSGIDFKSGFHDQIQLLREFMSKHGLNSTADADTKQNKAPPPAVVLRDLAKLVGRSCQLCQAAIRSEGVRVLELISTDPDQLRTIGHTSSGERSPWAAALEAMRLSPEQAEQLLILRRSHLEKMRTIYAERQGLNLEAMALMLPHHSRDPAEDNTLEGRMSNMATQGYLSVAKSNAELASVLDRIKDNLRREQRYVMDLNCCTISRILTPIQAARYMTTVYPRHCDALALSNVLANTLGRADSDAAAAAATAAVDGAVGMGLSSAACSGAIGARGCC